MTSGEIPCSIYHVIHQTFTFTKDRTAATAREGAQLCMGILEDAVQAGRMAEAG